MIGNKSRVVELQPLLDSFQIEIQAILERFLYCFSVDGEVEVKNVSKLQWPSGELRISGNIGIFEIFVDNRLVGRVETSLVKDSGVTRYMIEIFDVL